MNSIGHANIPSLDDRYGRFGMAFIVRRVFYAKVGKADPLVDHHKEGERFLQERGIDFKTRILTDYNSGRNDRVVVEWQVEDLADWEEAFAGMTEDPAAVEWISTWEPRLHELIQYSEADILTLR